MKKFSSLAVALASLAVATPAFADEVIVNTVAPLPSGKTWGTIPGENTGTAIVTDSVARSGNGSLELKGDRNRAQLGVQYGYPATSTNLGTFSDVTGLTFDWRIAGDSVSSLSPFLTPALRLLIGDSTGRKELIWEGAYNGTYANTSFDTWYTSGINDKFYITGGSVNDGQTIAQWASQLTGASVLGISVGNGSSSGAGYHAFADNVSFTKGGASTTYNFETAAVAGAVPEPAIWLMMIVGFGLVGAGIRRQIRISNDAFEVKMKKAYAAI